MQPTGAPLVRLLLLTAACGLAACQSLRVQPSASLVELEEGRDPEPTYLLKKQYTVKIQCVMTANDSSALSEPSFQWHRVGSNASLDSRYSTVDELSPDKRNFTSVLWIRKPNNEDIVNYTCAASTKNLRPAVGVAQVQSRPLISFVVEQGASITRVSDVALWPGDSVSIRCIAEGNPASTVVYWSRNNSAMSNSSWLNLTGLSFEKDRGFVECTARNVYGENNAKIYLRVKNPQAYLPPLLIIIGELIVIAIVVAVYEVYMYKKRKQNQLDEPGEAYKTD